MGQFDDELDGEDGLTLTPGPDLAPQPQAPALPPDMPTVGPRQPYMTAPIAPTPPNHQRTPMQNIVQMALLGLAAGLGPRRGGGLPQGLAAGHQANEAQAQRDFQNQQVTFHDQQAQYQQDQRTQQIAQQQQQREQQVRDAKLQQNLQIISGELKNAKTKEEYDTAVDRFGQMMAMTGESRITANWLRGTMPYRAPQAKQVAGDALTAFFKNPLTQQQMKSDPNAVANGSMKVDLNGDGVPELVPIRQVMEVAGMSVLADDKGQPVSLTTGAQGDLKHQALTQLQAQFRVENRREPSPKEMLGLIAKAEAVGREPKAPDPNAQGKVDDADAIADAIVDGSQPPDLSRLYGAGAHVRAALARKGYNLTAAQQDWTASQKFLSTANGQQQVKMRQGIDNAYHSLDVIDQLAQQWQGGKYPLLNKGRLAAARSGALGPDAQKIATQLDAQIADVTAELGNVYMGGNSPTDHALQLASQNLQSDWSLPTLQAALKLARQNLQIRQNSMRNVGPVGAGGGPNQYAQPSPAAAPPPEEWVRNPQTGKLEKKR